LPDVVCYPRLPGEETHQVLPNELILDIGPMSAATICGAIGMSRTLVWNGTAGVTETVGINGTRPPFAHGSETILRAVEGTHHDDKNRPFTVVGGGDTVGYVMANAMLDEVTGKPTSIAHVSTGGGASLELMSGNLLPGVEALMDKNI
jgi:phosphoglycerate kinase